MDSFGDIRVVFWFRFYEVCLFCEYSVFLVVLLFCLSLSVSLCLAFFFFIESFYITIPW